MNRMQTIIFICLFGFFIAWAIPACAMHREKLIAESTAIALRQHAYAARYEPEFAHTQVSGQHKYAKEHLPHFVQTVPYDCMVTVKKVGDYEDPGMTHTMYARDSYNIRDAQSIILIKIREHTKDFSVREDGRLNPDQQVSCAVRCTMPNDPLNRQSYVFSMRAGDAWQQIENIMMHHLGSLEKRESK